MALACEGVTYTIHGARLMAVTGVAARITVEAWGTGVTATPSYIGSASARGWKQCGSLRTRRMQVSKASSEMQRSELLGEEQCSPPPETPQDSGGTIYTHLHWPLSMSQVGSVSSWTPGPEQLHSSQPTRGWQPKLCGWQTRQSGGMVRGGHMH